MDKQQLSATRWVTFCMTTYRRPEFLRKQLAGILHQTFQDFAIIISDNDPDASARETVASFNEPRIQYYVNEANLGMVKSFNRSLAKAKSEYVVMITDDDPIYPDMLQTLFNLSMEYPGYGMYYGGSDIFCENPSVAKSSRKKVGTNSCLADVPIDTIRTFTGNDFPLAFFDGRLGCHLLWSTGIVRREVALQIGGMPDYATPYLTDVGYVVLCGAPMGAVVINTSLGCQVVHGTNYGFTEIEYERFYLTPINFYNWIRDHLPKEYHYTGLEKLIAGYMGAWVVEHAISIKKILLEKKLKNAEFEKNVKKIFRIPAIRKWKIKYIIALRFPVIFQFLISIKNKYSKN